MVGTPNHDEPIPEAVRLDEAARVLNVSTAYVVRLIDEGKLPCHGEGDERRIKRPDLLAYKVKRDADRHAALDEITRIDQESGGYDD